MWNLIYVTCMHAQSLQSCPTLCNPMDGSPPGSSVHRILQGRVPEWAAMSSSIYDTNEFIYETETDSQTEKTDLWLPRIGWGRGRGMDWEFGVSRCKLLHLE